MEWEERFYCIVFDDLMEEREGIHVSHLVYPCLRRAYYDITTDTSFDLEGGMRMWIGKQIHKLPVSKHHELSLEWEDIRGTIDEYENGFFMDKKTTRNIPKRYPRSHHVKQVEMYRVLLEKNGYPVKEASILYIDVDSTRVKEYKVKLKRDIEQVELEMLRKKEIIETALFSRQPPNRHIDWLCRYCNHSSRCFHLENNGLGETVKGENE